MTNTTKLDPIETASLDELQALQTERLKWTLHHAYNNVPMYKRKFDAAGEMPMMGLHRSVLPQRAARDIKRRHLICETHSPPCSSHQSASNVAAMASARPRASPARVSSPNTVAISIFFEKF